jgi:trimethylamine:corrinoid methyltransferase-like protein
MVKILTNMRTSVRPYATPDRRVIAQAVAHFRERWYPSLIDRQDDDNWRSHGAKTMERRAAVKVEAILSKHEPDPLPQDAAQAVRAIVGRAEAEYGEG